MEFWKGRGHALLLAVVLFSPLAAKALPEVRLAVLAYGTLRWEVKTIESEGLDRENGFLLRTQWIATPQAARVAFLGKGVDLFVGDWLWAASQRLQGRKIQAAPYSLSHGALIVREGIDGLADLAGKRLGVAGGPLDKNWLLLQALYRERFGKPLTAKIVFGAPPLLNEQFKRGRLDALLTYWHYAARLEAAGFRRLFTGEQLMEAFGITTRLPALSYLFWEGWATQNPDLVRAFLKAAYTAKRKLCTEEEAWQRIEPDLGTEDPRLEALLKARYCGGIPHRFGRAEIEAARKLYRLLHGIDPKVAPSPELPEGLFYADLPLATE